MGIPHLTRHLQPFTSTRNLSGQAIVIDGPSLAYHIYFICLAVQRHARNPFEAAPTYKLLGDTTLRWLAELQNNGAILKKIFFDGFLPSTKNETRFSRLIKYTQQLQGYHGTWPQTIPSMHSSEISRTINPSLFEYGAVSSRLTNLPAVSFLVPAIIEKLHDSVLYRSITEVVPNEADLSCALFVRKFGGTVLTSDSDLLVHELGAEGAVCFLKDISVVDSSSGRVLRAPIYQPKKIVERLDLGRSHGISSLAFEMINDPHASIQQLKERAKKLVAVVANPQKYEEFVCQYSQLPLDAGEYQFHEEGSQQSRLIGVLKRLDPRVSEYVLQFPFIAKQTRIQDLLSKDIISGRGNFRFFLPFLLDCPAMKSAWEMSSAIRLLAYSLLNLILPETESVSTITEYKRMQNSARGREWQLPNTSEVLDACTGHLEILQQIRRRMPMSSNSHAWRVVALHQDIIQAHNSEITSLTSKLTKLTSSNDPHSVTWDAIHLSAQMQGSFYSFRILKQILAIVYCLKSSDTLPRPIHDLKLELETLPSLSNLPGFLGDMEYQGGVDFVAEVGVVRDILITDDPNQVVEGSLPFDKKEMRKKRKRQEATDSAQISHQRTNNIFDVLRLD